MWNEFKMKVVFSSLCSLRTYFFFFFGLATLFSFLSPEDGRKWAIWSGEDEDKGRFEALGELRKQVEEGEEDEKAFHFLPPLFNCHSSLLAILIQSGEAFERPLYICGLG